MLNSDGGFSDSSNKKIIRGGFLLFTSIVLLLVSVSAWLYFNKSAEESKRFKFERIADQAVSRMESKISTTVNLLYDLRSIVSGKNMSSSEWDNFLLRSDLEERFPKMYSLGYAEIVEANKLREFENNLKNNEKGGTRYDTYKVFPPSENKHYYPIKYLHTSDLEVATLLGFDLGFASEFNDALNQSIETGDPRISELMSMSEIIPTSKQQGYLIFLPVYSTDASKELTIDDRKKYLVGLVGSWLTPKFLTDGVATEDFNFEVFDSADHISSNGVGNVYKEVFSIKKELKVLNKVFTVEFNSTEKFRINSFEENLPLYSLIVILLINALWYITVYLILSSRTKAIKLAQQATSDLTKFKLAVEGVSDHVVITNAEGKIIYANKAAEKITGYTNEEMMGKTPSLWGRQTGRKYYNAFWKRVKKDKKPFTGKITNRRKSMELYDVEISVSPILDNKGRLLYLVGIERDITKQKALEKVKAEFISLASHQLRTPLSAVKWFGKMLSDGDAGPLNNLQTQYLNKINESNEREISLVNALLNISRIESGRIVVEPKMTKMRDLVESVVTEVKMNAIAVNKELVWSVDKDVPEMYLDPNLIRNVYMNLLTNGVKYTRDGGRVEIQVTKRDQEILSEVKDNGIGIPPKEQERIFEKFFRASNAAKKETDGNGLGLFLAKTIVESSGGKMGFVTKENEGTTFWFTLPTKGVKKKKGKISVV